MKYLPYRRFELIDVSGQPEKEKKKVVKPHYKELWEAGQLRIKILSERVFYLALLAGPGWLGLICCFIIVMSSKS